jgi:hypothetical protein
MKNLPDKIYLNFGEITKEEFEASDYNDFCKLDEFAVTFCEDRVYDTDVEYVRKNAFIEKACEWFDMHFHETEVDDRCGESRYVVMSGHDVFKDGLLEDFKKYMEE